MQIYSWGKASTTKARYAFGILCAHANPKTKAVVTKGFITLESATTTKKLPHF